MSETEKLERKLKIAFSILAILLFLAVYIVFSISTNKNKPIEPQMDAMVAETVTRYVDWNAQVVCYYTLEDIYCLPGTSTALFK